MGVATVRTTMGENMHGCIYAERRWGIFILFYFFLYLLERFTTEAF